MGTLIDSSVLVEAERGRFDLERTLTLYPEEVFSIATITVAEVLHGLHRAVREEQRRRRERFVEYMLTTYPVLSFDLETAQVHARLWAGLASVGITVGAHDLIIAATAVSHGLQVATRDLRGFPKIPGLAVAQW